MHDFVSCFRFFSMSNSTATVLATKYSMEMVKRVAERMSKKEDIDGLKVCD